MILLRRRHSQRHLGHVPGAQHTTSEPKIFIPVPVFVLGTADLGSQQWGTNRHVLIKNNAIFEKTPHPINDLGPSLCFDDVTCGWVLVLCHFDIARLSPLPFALHFDFLLAVTDIVVENPCCFHLVGLGCVSMENDTTVFQVLVGKRAPLLLPDCTWARGPFGGSLGLQSVQNQSLGLASLHKTAPLLPLHRSLWISGHVLQVLGGEGGFICFYVNPRLAIPKDDGFFNGLHPGLAQDGQALVHVLDHFVVGTEKAVNDWVRHSVQKQK